MTIQSLLGDVLSSSNMAANSYFCALRAGTFEKDDFVETQIQFHFAVEFFGRPMAVLGARMPSSGLRMEVIRNVWEEHGMGNAAATHGATFRTFLSRLAGLERDDIEARDLWPEVRAFNTVLTGISMADDWEVGTACFGMIERMFVDISSWIGRGVVQNGWLAQDEMIHYSTHEELDIKHAEDFFDALVEGTDASDEARYRVEQGMRLGAYVFLRMYEDLYAARARRWRSAVAFPQANLYRS